MATKLKNFSRQWYCKIIAFLLILLLGGSALWAILSLDNRIFNNGFEESIFFEDDYTKSNYAFYKIEDVINDLLTYTESDPQQVMNQFCDKLMTLYGSSAVEYYLAEGYYFIGDAAIESTERIDVTNIDMQYLKERADATGATLPSYLYDDIGLMSFISSLSKETMDKLWQQNQEQMIQGQSRRQAEKTARLESYTQQYYYYIQKSTIRESLSNATEAAVRALPFYIAYEDDMFKAIGEVEKIYYADYLKTLLHLEPTDVILIGYQPEYSAQLQADWTASHKLAVRLAIHVVSALAIALLLFIYLCIVTGRKPNSNEAHVAYIDRMFTEVWIVLGMIGLAVFMSIMDSGAGYIFDNYDAQSNTRQFVMLSIVGITCAAAAYAMAAFLSMLRSIKAHRFIKSFACGRILLAFFRWAKETFIKLWNGGSMMARGMAVAIIVPMLCGIWLPIPFVIAGLAYLIYRYISSFQKIQEGLRQVKAGNLNYKITDIQGNELCALAEDINTLSDGLDSAVAGELRAERLKTELISNVSHDIKTPLTSLITYVDLLQTELAHEAPEQEKMKNYADILEQKADRLKTLTADLFEAAKASSGAINVNFERVDMQAIVQQSLGEYEEKLAAAELDIRVNMPENPVYVYADGRLVWRIIENMLSNITKYALKGSRVYVDVENAENGAQVVLTMKNMSAYELNISASELMERFKRGDEARSSEGSGLGLSIAMSLAHLQNGDFYVQVDGDLFKATLTMPVFTK